MKAVILAGGLGTRISEESHLRPKPMIEIGGQPILWHIMKMYSHHGVNDFVICAGYKQQMIKEYFADYFLHCSDVTFDFSDGGKMQIHSNVSEPWKVTVVDTGMETMTGGRIKRIKKYVDGETFMLTYGDGVSDVEIDKLQKFHKKCGKRATLTAVRPDGRFGILDMNGDAVASFREKTVEDAGWVNGGFMVLEPEVFDYIKGGDDTIFERDPLEKLSADGQLAAFRHPGFWQCMDTLRDKEKLEDLWKKGRAPWKTW
ncbi:MAG: glucose-1-phosphate cytidylyltransferase [Methanomassiliicoccaceae archaeon]|nr:glucose-1-phosphate cytidylyltransferase [Methanomassiliicoccaceae archaeon]